MAHQALRLISILGWLATAWAVACQPGCAVGADSAAESCPESPWRYSVTRDGEARDVGRVCAAEQALPVEGWAVAVDVEGTDALGRSARAVRVEGQSTPIMTATCGLAPASSWLTADGERVLLTVWCSDDWRAE